MFDRYLIPLQSRVLRPAAAWLDGRGVQPDTVSIVGFATGPTVVPLLAFGHFGAAAVAILANRVMDGLDGVLARRRGATERGAFIDIAFDFAFYALVPFGFALADPDANALATATLLLGFIGTGSSFLAFAAVAAGSGNRSTQYPTKGIYYIGGLTEGAETIAAFLAMCLWPHAFPTIAYGFASLCAVTTATRWWWG
ncbi:MULTISPECIES: CDP-alcohol phosphatidyltransferase family protein [unclassified Ensifer]|uniref:CDP-alcohol phosphatidyltransferase family protein n=1 Tax=unclassified Ensifer TaxID=2633371 RepID=UPI000813547E|nr:MULTISPECIES: CDP-alcohol phosphatidyltransferase family protein [unclassified Ensifer]OCP19368.1 hypothetical protein BC361_31065 [Ensifer sp. LC54]OCP19506.1 hypothetical protein BC363_31060 [Ensifer sp. LC384]